MAHYNTVGSIPLFELRHTLASRRRLSTNEFVFLWCLVAQFRCKHVCHSLLIQRFSHVDLDEMLSRNHGLTELTFHHDDSVFLCCFLCTSSSSSSRRGRWSVHGGIHPPLFNDIGQYHVFARERENESKESVLYTEKKESATHIYSQRIPATINTVRTVDRHTRENLLPFFRRPECT